MELDPEYLPSNNEGSEDNNSQVDVEDTSSISVPKARTRSKKSASKRPKQRKFTGNRFTKWLEVGNSSRLESSSEASATPMSPTTPMSPLTPRTPPTQMSTSSLFFNDQILSYQASTTTAISKLGSNRASMKINKISVKLRQDDGTVKMSEVYVPNCNLVINSNVIQEVIKYMAVCRECREGDLELLDKGRKSSCSSYLVMRCKLCFYNKIFWSVSGYFGSAKLKVGNANIPKRNTQAYSSVLGGRIIGVGQTLLNFYHASLDIPLPPSTGGYFDTQSSILIAAEELAIKSMETARKELAEFLGYDPLATQINAIASYDGAYQQRTGKSGGGFSRYCFASAISVDTAKVLSYGIACNSCALCSKYNNKLREGSIGPAEYKLFEEIHNPVCPAKFAKLASVHLESAIAPQIVKDALGRGIKFTGLCCDGDNKTHDTLNASDVYKGLENPEIIRYECLSHVAKRMKINLSNAQGRNLKGQRKEKEFDQRQLRAENSRTEAQISKLLTRNYKGSLVRDSRKRLEWGSSESIEIRTISEAICGQIASYYRLAVKRNKGNIKEIIKGIYAIPYHLSANNENAEEYHRYCPKNEDSWCLYQASVAAGREPPNHPNYLSLNCLQLILKVFQDFGYDTPEFVSKISDGHTSNHNESIHSVLFKMVKKTETVGIEIMKLGAALAVIRYNEGFSGIQTLYESLGIEFTDGMICTFNRLDNTRINRSRFIIREQSKRYHKKQIRSKKTTSQIKKHGEGYASGRYSAAQKLDSESNSSNDEGTQPEQAIDTQGSTQVQELDNTSLITSSSLEEPEVICEKCGGNEENRHVGIGLSCKIIQEEIAWIGCDKCLKWYHKLCLGLELEDQDEDEWYCDNCILVQ